MSPPDGTTPRVRSQSPPSNSGESNDAGGGGKQAPPRRPAGRSQFDKLEAKLEELFATAAMGQQALALATADPRHARGAAVTNQLGPPMASAWVGLAKENNAVKRVLEKLVEGSAWGAVIMTTTGFVYSSAQAYEVLPEGFPNPWARGDDGFIPPSDETMAQAAADMRQDGASRPAGPAPKGPPNSGVDEPLSTAEQTRRDVEARRQARGS